MPLGSEAEGPREWSSSVPLFSLWSALVPLFSVRFPRRVTGIPYPLPPLPRLLHTNLFFFWLCREACRILVPRPEVEPTPPAMKAQGLNHRITREVLPPAQVFILPDLTTTAARQGMS